MRGAYVGCKRCSSHRHCMCPESTCIHRYTRLTIKDGRHCTGYLDNVTKNSEECKEYSRWWRIAIGDNCCNSNQIIYIFIFCPFMFSHWKLPETSVCIPCVSEVLMVMRALHVMHSRYRRASLSNVALRVYGAVDTALHHATRVVICELVEFGTA